MVQEKKVITIYVEGTPQPWPKDDISYAQVVQLEYPDFEQHPEITYTVTYERGQGNKPEGALAKGASVKVKDGMRFNVTESGQS